MPNDDACVGWSLLTSEVLKDRVMVISLMVGCWRDGNCLDGNRECTTGNVDDQLCVCRTSRVETETELDL